MLLPPLAVVAFLPTFRYLLSLPFTFAHTPCYTEGFPSPLLVLFLFLQWFTWVSFSLRLLFLRFFLRYRCFPPGWVTLASVPVSYPYSFVSPFGIRRFSVAHLVYHAPFLRGISLFYSLTFFLLSAFLPVRLSLHVALLFVRYL